MRLGFRHGLVRYQTDITSTPNFLLKSSGGTYIDLNVSPDPTIVTISHGVGEYLVQESQTVVQAWGPFIPGPDYWLYIDIDLMTAERTFGYSTLNPIASFSQPNSHVEGQHWFDLTETMMKVRHNGRWIETVRIFVGKYENGSIVIPYSLGSSVGLSNITIDSGSILLDEDSKPIRKIINNRRWRFITTETILSSHAAKFANIKLETILHPALAEENIPAFYLVTYTDANKIGLASHTNFNANIVGIAPEDIYTGELRNYITGGMVTNTNWAWTEPAGTVLFCGEFGEVTTTVPQFGIIQQIGMIISSDTILLDIKHRVLIKPPLNRLTINIDKSTGEFVGDNVASSNNVAGGKGYRFIQTTPALVWNITHGLGTSLVLSQVFNLGLESVIPDSIEIIDDNNMTVNFVSPQAGYGHIVVFEE